MTDVLTPEQRSYCMSRIRGRDTKPELLLRTALWAAGLRYRLANRLPGKPDIVFPGRRVAVFVDGCFWHGCPEHYKRPFSNTEFWDAKISGNRERDNRRTKELRKAGWKVIRIWDHEIKKNPLRVVNKVVRALEA